MVGALLFHFSNQSSIIDSITSRYSRGDQINFIKSNYLFSDQTYS